MLIFMNDKRGHPLGEHAHETEITSDKPHVNKREFELDISPERTYSDIDTALNERVGRIEEELVHGMKAINQYPKSVTFFGSARTPEGDEHYERARRLAGRLCNEGYAVITGGGPGIMEAGNRGTKEVCGHGIGFNIELSFEQVINPYVTHGVNFHYFFTRKVAMAFSAEAYLCFPGGYGTLDELFEMLTLIQTHKVPRVPVVLVGGDFWQPLDTFIRGALLQEYQTISPEDINLYRITDDEDEIVEIVKKAPLRNEYQN